MIADDAQPHVILAAVAVGLARQIGGDVDDGEDLVDLVHVVHALQQQGDALQAKTGVDVVGGQISPHVEIVLGADRGELLGLEDQVPDF